MINSVIMVLFTDLGTSSMLFLILPAMLLVGHDDLYFTDLYCTELRGTKGPGIRVRILTQTHLAINPEIRKDSTSLGSPALFIHVC